MKSMPCHMAYDNSTMNNCFVKLFDVFKETNTTPIVTRTTLKKKVHWAKPVNVIGLESKKLNLKNAIHRSTGKQKYEHKRPKNTVKRKTKRCSGIGRIFLKCNAIKKSSDLLSKPCQSNNSRVKDEQDTSKNTCIGLHGSNLPTMRNCFVKLKDVFTELNTTLALPKSDTQISSGSSDFLEGQKLNRETTKPSTSKLLNPTLQESFHPKRQLTLKLFKLNKTDIRNIMGKKEHNMKNKLNKETKVKRQKLTPVANTVLNTESTSDFNVQGNQAEAPFELITVEYVVSEDPTFHGTIVQIVDSCDQDITHKFVSPQDASDENTVPLMLEQAIL